MGLSWQKDTSWGSYHVTTLHVYEPVVLENELLNSLHMTCIYTTFYNSGNIIKPYLVYQSEERVEDGIQDAFSTDVANRVLEGTIQVVNDSNGTGYAHREDIVLAGKTGTAGIKVSKEKTADTELGWFAFFTAEDTVE